jgi:hypothetical protein
MSRVAVFVDAAYLFGQGSAALNGAKVSRSLLSLDAPAAIMELKAIAAEKSADAPLLRLYWYDTALGSRGITAEQAALANADHVKLRLGFANRSGQQKGVDSLIVADLVELARNRAIGDAVLLSGDEDVRVGVQIAQSFGVRVHLLGIVPSRGSQSHQLIQEADTTSEWDRATVARFLSIKSASAPARIVEISVGTSVANHTTDGVLRTVGRVAEEFAARLDRSAVADLQAFWSTAWGVPRDLDGKLLASCRLALGRDLDIPEKRYMRKRFTEAVQPLLPAASEPEAGPETGGDLVGGGPL